MWLRDRATLQSTWSVFSHYTPCKQTHPCPPSAWCCAVLYSMAWSTGLHLNLDRQTHTPSGLLTPLRLNLPRELVCMLFRSSPDCNRVHTHPRLARVVSHTQEGECGPVANGVSGDWALMAIQYLGRLGPECFLSSAAVCPYLKPNRDKLGPCLLPLTASG